MIRLRTPLLVQTLLSAVLLLSLLMVSCAPGAQQATPLPDRTAPSQAGPAVAGAGPVVVGGAMIPAVASAIGPYGRGQAAGLRLRLSEGSENAPAAPPAPLAAGQPLSDAEAQGVLARLPALEPAASDRQNFALPRSSLPPPRPGSTIGSSFPPSGTLAAPGAPASGPLQVLRYSPEGDVPLAPYLSLTFSQPMVAVSSQEDLAQGTPPVRLSPQPDGAWRWVGAQTLLFEPSGQKGAGTTRLPMATFYTATVPAGTTSATGGVLADALTFTFDTPPPQVVASYPDVGPQRLDPLMFVSFDQRVDPAAVLPTISAMVGGSAYPLHLATQDEVQADDAVQRLADSAGAGRWLAFEADRPFPGASRVEVTIGPGTPSAEGPRTTETTQSFDFTTYGPLRIVESSCNWNDDCPPFASWSIRFSNPLDSAAFDDSLVGIAPALPGANVDVYGDTIQIQGLSRGRTTYTVTVRASLADQFGSTLGTDQSVTFAVGPAPQAITALGNGFVVLDPTAARPQLSVFTTNFDRLDVRAFAVAPGDWPAYLAWLATRGQDPSTRQAPPGTQVLSTSIDVAAAPDQLVETPIDLSPALTNGLGQLVLLIDPQPQLDPSQHPGVQLWVQSSRIGLDAFVDGSKMLAWANSLAGGEPLPGVQLSLLGTPVSATTGAEGLATLPLPDAANAGLLVATSGDDTAILPQNPNWGGGDGWRRAGTKDSLRWMVFDDRGMYRPGEQVHVKGWIRRFGAGPDGDVGPLQGGAAQVSYQLADSQGNDVLQGGAPVNVMGGFDMSFTLPAGMNLGSATLALSATLGLTAEVSGGVDGLQYQHTFQVQEFRRPEFQVSAESSEGPHFVGDHAIATVSAGYYASGALPDAQVDWQVTASPAAFSPPGWDDFTFGTWVPWWGAEDASPMPAAAPGMPILPASSSPLTFTGRTDASGRHQLRIDFASMDTPAPATVVAQATVMDVNRQAWTAETDILVHPADLYVGLRSPRLFVERGQPLDVDAIVVDLDGKAQPGRQVAVTASRLEWKRKPGAGDDGWQQVETAPQACTVQSAAAPVACHFDTSVGGEYRVTATIQDDQARPNRSQLTLWVSGEARPPARQVQQEQVTLIPDRKDYRPGETAEILVDAPFSPARGVMTLRRSGIVSSQPFTMTGPSYTLEVPIQDAYVPNVQVQVDLDGEAPRVDDAGNVDPELPMRPAFASGSLDLSVPALSRTLQVQATPRDKALAPGGSTTVDILLKDAAGRPVEGAEVAVVVVDEAVLALTDYQTPDPIGVFYSPRDPDTSDYHLRSNLVLANPGTLGAGEMQAQHAPGVFGELAQGARFAAPAAAPAALAAGATVRSVAQPQAPIALRTDFDPLAVFTPTLATDAQGKAQVEIKLPDNLTRYRVMAVAVAGGKQFGSGESTITARLPLMVRASPPRFLNFGDRFELPVVLQNQTDSPMAVDVAVRGSNLTFAHVTSTISNVETFDAQRVTVPADDRVEVRFPASADRPGTARFQVAAVQVPGAPGEALPVPAADAAQLELPVWTPATTEAFATYGEIDAGAIAQPVIAPTDVYTQFGGLEITTSSTALQALTDAVLYLESYPYECSEQLASRVMAVAALRDVLTAFHATGLPSPDAMNAGVDSDIARLQALQNDDGSFPLWSRGDDAYPYVTVYVIHALQEARSKGYQVPDDVMQRAGDYLQNIELHIPSWYGQDARDAIIAYSLYVRDLMGDGDAAQARGLIDENGVDDLPTEAIGWLLPVLSGDPVSVQEVGEIRRYLDNRAVETAGAASFTTSYGDDDYLLMHSDRRTDAVILDALITDQPKSDLIPKIVQGLLAGRTQGRWDSTQENSFVLLALDHYFNTYEAQTPDFVARLWLGDQYVGGAAFQGRTIDRQQVDVPMAYLAGQQAPAGTAQSLLLSKDGTGRLYYRIGMTYAPKDLVLAPAEQGFTVERTYEAVDSPGDVRRDPDGTWHVRAGAQVRVRLTMVAPARRYFVALADPLPAGFEAENPALAVTGRVPQDRDPQASGGGFWWWIGPWYEHQNLRDDRVEAFTSLLWEGVYTYSYVARATTPGEFIVPPARAEEMYSPETYGRTGTDRVVVQ